MPYLAAAWNNLRAALERLPDGDERSEVQDLAGRVAGVICRAHNGGAA